MIPGKRSAETPQEGEFSTNNEIFSRKSKHTKLMEKKQYKRNISALTHGDCGNYAFRDKQDWTQA